MAKKILTAHFLEDHLKKGWCLDDFTRHFEVDQKEFYRLLGRVTKNSHYVDNYKSRLAANEKKRKKHNIASDSDDAKNNTEPVKITESTNKEKAKMDELGKLQAEEAALIEDINGDKQKTESLKSSEGKAKKKLEELNREIARISKDLADISSQLAKNALNLEQSEQKLRRVQEQIKQLTKITVFAYSDGKIEIEGAETIPENWGDVFTKIVHYDSVEECTVKQIKQFAKIILISKSFEDRVVEVSWEDLNMQTIFESLK